MEAEILPPAGEQHCRSGLLCGLEVCITRLTEPAEGEMAEESKTDNDGLKTTKLMYEGMSRMPEFPHLDYMKGEFESGEVGNED